jgi:NAD(P)-dependent dehydrogenase (short-subunit alcohol dehydrogenase family)
MKRLDPAEVAACRRVLEAIGADRGLLADLDEESRRALLVAAGRVAMPVRHEVKRLRRTLQKRERQADQQHDVALLSAAQTRTAQRSSAFILPDVRGDDGQFLGAELRKQRACYICKQPYTRVHVHYHALCPECAALNWQKRFQRADLSGRVALVTGARIKIGFQAALMLLRAGARVIATTRFPSDAAERFAAEPDFSRFASRLEIHGLDLRHLGMVEAFAAHLGKQLDRLDVLVNNAAQTVRRPPHFYAHLVEREARPLPPSVQPLLAAPGDDDAALVPLFPRGLFDADGQQVDLRRHNSWRMTLGDVPTVEMLEVHLVNAIAPCVLTARCKPLLVRARGAHVVHVSAMEAQFSRKKKTDKHPHTNMAKASLNMMTRTSAVDYQRDAIYMNSVDTGWVTDEDPLHHVSRKQRDHDFHAPLDAIDGAARVLDPVFLGYGSGQNLWGLFLKDYRPIDW